MPIIGHFERIQQNHAIGWALVPEQRDQRVTVNIVASEHVIATGVADRLHRAVADKGIGDGRYGFAIALPQPADSNDAVLRASVAGTWLNGAHPHSASAPGSPPAAIPSGNIDGVAAGVIFGWVEGNAPAIAIRLADQTLGQAKIGAARPDIVAQGLAASACNFYFDLKPHLNPPRKTSSKTPRNNRPTALDKPITLIHVASGKALAGSPVTLADTPVYGHAEPRTGLHIHGWATFTAPHTGAQHAQVELWVDGSRALSATADLPRPDLARLGIGVGQIRCGFKLGIPCRALDGQPHHLEVRHAGSGERLANGSQHITARVHHGITYANYGVVTGWLFVEPFPQQPIALEAWEDQRCVGRALAHQPQPAAPGDVQQRYGAHAVGFTLPLVLATPTTAVRPTRRIRLCLAGQSTSLTDQDILIAARAELIHHLQHAAQQDDTCRWWLRDLISQLRHSDALDGSTPDGSLFKLIPSRIDVASSAPIDIIIPVYKGRAETLACLHSLLACGDPTPHQIIVINDASPDAALTEDLRCLAAAEQHATPPRLTLLENPRNQGFVASVNRGMRLHPERDVLLLNADTLVPASNWLARLRAAADADHTIATVTPFSNRATICSLPRPNVDNDLPAGLDVTALDTLCHASNPGHRVAIPTAVGFCMFIKRAALAEVGLFDEERWAKGYGEENDFCLKAASIGWQHVAAADVFVQHHGAVSFQGEKAARVEENLNRLNTLYPDYPATIARFIRHDPLAEPRNRVVLQLMQAGAATLHITHAWGGGVHHHVDQLCREQTHAGSHPLILRPSGDGRIEIIQPRSHQTDADLALSLPLSAIDNLTDPANPLLERLRELGVGRIHLHQWIGLPPAIWQLAAVLGIPLDYTVHDFYAFCPRVHLLDHTGQFCEQAPVTRCAHCVNASPLDPEVAAAFVALGSSVAAWRTFHHHQLTNARHLSAPSQDAAQRLQSALSLKHVKAKPHSETALRYPPKPLPKPGTPLRIAVIGAIGPNKGYNLLLDLAQRAAETAPHLHFVIVGYTMDDTPFASLTNIYITGKYAPEELPNLLEQHDCHVALFLSPVPETYSYTLSEALRAGLTPVVPALGALGERVTDMKLGHRIAAPLTAARVLDVLQTLARPHLPQSAPSPRLPLTHRNP